MPRKPKYTPPEPAPSLPRVLLITDNRNVEPYAVYAKTEKGVTEALLAFRQMAENMLAPNGVECETLQMVRMTEQTLWYAMKNDYPLCIKAGDRTYNLISVEVQEG